MRSGALPQRDEIRSPTRPKEGKQEMNNKPDPSQLADRHAKEAERLLARRFGFLDYTLKAQAHATLAVYYSTEARQ